MKPQNKNALFSQKGTEKVLLAINLERFVHFVIEKLAYVQIFLYLCSRK